ncbi:hypothetical protein AQUCO_03000109v1 [Aquilegia coerulea]|uniref:Pentacotripeptide-repeat region of PRORP domain-containing protein n=1 Tax=Aquilegia coerulea TaxID=218851 RepID=A0A2G5D193_AQUCA|nr:hypothetical protein AQUCO_03000109v1 [Aquilegia coerulea]
MLEFGVEPNAFTLSAVIKHLGEVLTFDSNYIVSALIDMYGRNDGIEECRRLFNEMPEPDAVCWTAVISALTRNDRFKEALWLFYFMHREYRLFPDGFTFGTILTACGNLARVKQGKEVHAKVITFGYCGNLVVESSLLDMYGKCGLVEDSRRVFDGMQNKNVVSRCALLGAYCQNGDFKPGLSLFREMEMRDMYCFGTLIRVCAGLTVVRQGKRIFLGIPARNLITWNTMISGFAQNGNAGEALSMFNVMVNQGTKPDSITFIAVLFACSHSGLVDQGREYLKIMNEVYKINAGIEHYCCMVDLLGRAGFIEEAENLLGKSVYRDDLSLWGALLGACTSYSNLHIAERIAKKMMELNPKHHLSYVLLANIYRALGQWDDAENLRKLMKDRGVQKIPGQSWIDIKNKGSDLDPDNSGFLQNRYLSATGE